jgi:arylsulfatase A
MNRREFLAGAAAAAQRPAPHLNVIVILADDLGARDLGCYGHPQHRTPNLDALARGGVRFETCYATPLCSPSRVELLSGRYAFRTGWYNFLGRATTRKDRIEADLFTIADLAHTRGYRTAMTGKWQLGEIHKHPTMIADSGFDEYHAWDWPRRARYWDPLMVINGKKQDVAKGKYGPDLHHEWLIDFMRRQNGKPFLAYYPTTLTHEPWDPTPHEPKGGFAANLEYLDTLIGRLMKALDESGLRRNTAVLFVGDNGTGKSGKGTTTELGVRVPAIANCPGVIPGGRVLRDLIDFSDILPTVADLIGARLPQDIIFDGRSFAPQLRGEKGNPREWIFSYLAYDRILRDRRWLLEGDGRLFDCGESRDGTGYRDVTQSTDAEATAARKRFDKILAKLPGPPVDPTEPPEKWRSGAERKNRK